MNSDKLYFSIAEYQARLDKVKTAMREQGIDVLLISDPSNMNWLTGYDGWSFYVHQGLIVSLDCMQPIWFGRMQDRYAALIKCYIDDDNMIGYPEDHIMNPDKHPMTWIANHIVQENGWHAARIGTEMDNYYYSALAHEALTHALPQATFVNANALVNWCRAIKSPKEIEYMRIAGKICTRIFDTVLEMAEVGLPKNQLVAEIYRVAVNGVDGYCGDYPAIVPLLPSGVEAQASHLTWDEQPFRANESTFFELAGCYRRYHCPLSRTIYFGQPEAKFLNAEAALQKALELGLEQAKPGNRTGDIAKALDGVMHEYGIDRKGARCGYPIGLSYPPDWGERTMSLRAFDETELQPGMTFHFMPGIWQDGWGIEITESIVITETGVETFTHFPRKLFIK